MSKNMSSNNMLQRFLKMSVSNVEEVIKIIYLFISIFIQMLDLTERSRLEAQSYKNW